MNLKHSKITEDIIGAAFEVHNILGYGFLEKVYKKAMQVELIQRGHQAEIEYPITIYFKGANVGDYFADIIVDGKVIVELKVAPQYNQKDEAQLLNELKATGKEVGMLVNFGKKEVEHKRFVF